MEVVKAAILGIVQGVTEFLPVSSSGHLVIGAELLGFQEEGVAFDTFLHLGTLVAVVVVFRRELVQMMIAPLCYWQKNDGETRRFFLLDLYIVVSTLPAVVVGLFYADTVERLFTSSFFTYCMLIVTGMLMIGSRRLAEGVREMDWCRALVVGCAQACAILPGLSRSGSTIFAGMALGIPRERIARFSFLMSIPAIVGAAVLQGRKLLENPPESEMWLTLAVGVCTAAFAGYLAIHLLLGVIRRNRLSWFGYYCLVVAALGLTHHLFFSA